MSLRTCTTMTWYAAGTIRWVGTADRIDACICFNCKNRSTLILSPTSKKYIWMWSLLQRVSGSPVSTPVCSCNMLCVSWRESDGHFLMKFFSHWGPRARSSHVIRAHFHPANALLSAERGRSGTVMWQCEWNWREKFNFGEKRKSGV